MAVLTLSNIRKAYGTRELFDDVSFFINERERVGLIGANGTGKTTLLRIICEEDKADSGTISKEPGITLGYLPQDVDLPGVAGLHLAVTGVTPELLACAAELAVLEKRVAQAHGEEAHGLGARYAELSHQFDTLSGFEYQVRARTILLGLGFDESELDTPIHSLSGGQKTRAALARLLLLSPDVLLLDEPTNHLDIKACEWLQEFLQTRYQGAALIVSHDRYFLDQIVGKVIEIENGVTSTYPGSYSDFARQKAARIEEQRKLYKVQQKEIARVEQAIQTLFSDRKFSRRDSKVKELERIQRASRVADRKTIKVGLASAVRSGREVVRLSKLSKSYPGKDLFLGVSFVAERGQKIGIVGPNGSGKTTLLKIIADREPSDAGEVIFGHNVHPVYFAQEFDHLVPSRTVIEELLADTEITSREARDLLAKFLFMGDDAFKRVEVLSGGEQCRLALAKVLAAGPNLLLLDEPTNHLDISSREALEDALRAFNGTVIVASHDRYLLDAITSEIVEIKDGAFTPYMGNYSSYREKETGPPAPAPTPPGGFGKGVSRNNVASSASGGSGTRASRNNKAADPATGNRSSATVPSGGFGTAASGATPARPISSLREREKRHRDLTKRQHELERNIENAEHRTEEITAALGNEETYRDGSARELTLEYDETSAALRKLYAEWEMVCGEIQGMEEVSS